VTLELDDEYREVAIPEALEASLKNIKYTEKFHNLTYSKRKEFVRSVVEAKADETRLKRIDKVIDYLNNS
jgi:uncharacterized protein YdeI (YjbR/CyaY-like superfamily)